MMDIIFGILFALIGVFFIRAAFVDRRAERKEPHRHTVGFNFTNSFSSGIFALALSIMHLTKKISWLMWIPDFIEEWFKNI